MLTQIFLAAAAMLHVDVQAVPASGASPYAVINAPADPGAYFAELQRARALQAQGDFAEARTAFSRLTSLYPLDRETWSGLADAQRNLGRYREAIDAYAHAIELAGPFVGSARYWTAVSYAALGDREKTLETLNQIVFEDHDIDRPSLANDPAFKSLANDRRFQTIMGTLPTGASTRVDGWRADLRFLLSEMRRLSPRYRTAPLPGAVSRAAQKLDTDISTLSDAQIFAEFSKLVAAVKIGHTTMWGARSTSDGARAAIEFTYLPILLHAFPDGLYVVAARGEAADLIGAKLVSISDVSADDVLRRVEGATSFASASEALWTAPVRISEMRLLEGLGLANGDSARLALLTPAGVMVERVLQAGTVNPRSKLPAPLGVSVPTYLSRPTEAHWLQHGPDHMTAYAQVNQIADDPDETLAQFGLRLRREMHANQTRNLVIDLRHNNGGDTFAYKELLRTVVGFSTLEGRQVYVMIGREVYSAAANFSSDLERLASPIFVGEPTGMTGNQNGEEGRLVLPYSGLQATISAVDWQLSHPWDRRRSIAPQVPVALTARDYFAGIDPVRVVVENLIKAR